MPGSFTPFPLWRQPARYDLVSIHHPYDTTICQYDELTCRKDPKVSEILLRRQTFLPHSPCALHCGFSSLKNKYEIPCYMFTHSLITQKWPPF
jgi:hypothetical protein